MSRAETPTAEDTEKFNKMSRQLAEHRSAAKQLEVQFKELKCKYKQDIQRLNNIIKEEKNRRIQLYEDKVERSKQIMQELEDKDRTIKELNLKIA